MLKRLLTLPLYSVLLVFLVLASKTTLSATVPTSMTNSAECILVTIEPSTSAQQVREIEAHCFQQYPDRARVGLLGWADVGVCYDRYSDKAGNHHAALAIFSACERYFL